MTEKEVKVDLIKQRIKLYYDFPKKGVIFKDIFPLFEHPSLCNDVVELFFQQLTSNKQNVDTVVGLDSRGFLFAPQLAAKLGVSFVPIRKKGKLPGEVHSITYTLEYGQDTLEIQKHAIKAGENVVIVDDLLATGGTMLAAAKLVKQVNANVLECQVVVELTGLHGRKSLENLASVFSVVQYEF